MLVQINQLTNPIHFLHVTKYTYIRILWIRLCKTKTTAPTLPLGFQIFSKNYISSLAQSQTRQTTRYQKLLKQIHMQSGIRFTVMISHGWFSFFKVMVWNRTVLLKNSFISTKHWRVMEGSIWLSGVKYIGDTAHGGRSHDFIITTYTNERNFPRIIICSTSTRSNFVFIYSIELFILFIMKWNTNSTGSITSSFAFIWFAADDYFYANEVMMTLNIFYWFWENKYVLSICHSLLFAASILKVLLADQNFF